LPAVSEGNPLLADQLSDKLFEAQMHANMVQPVEPQQQPGQQQQGQQQQGQQLQQPGQQQG
jgi:hypothetical protein